MFVDFPPKEFSLEIAVLHVENTCYEYLEADNSGWLVDNFRLAVRMKGLGLHTQETFRTYFLARNCFDGFNMNKLTINN